MSFIEYQQQQPLTALIEQYPLVIVDFWAHWCAPCRAMLPSLNTLQQQFSELQVIKVNADEHPQLLADYQVRGLPTLLLWHQGQLVERTSETLTLGQFRQWLAPYLADQSESLLAKAQASSGAQRLDYLREAAAQPTASLKALESLIAELFEQREQTANFEELQQRLAALSAEQRRGPIISRIATVLAFAQEQDQHAEPLQPAFQLAVAERYEEALEQLIRLHEQGNTGAKALIVRILNLMPNRKQAHEFRRRLI